MRMARPEGFEPPTLCLEGRRSFQLSYGRSIPNFSHYKHLRYSVEVQFTAAGAVMERRPVTPPIAKERD